MNKMKFGAAAALAGVLAGCSTVDPLSIPQTDRDRQVYKADVTRPVPTERYKIAIISKALPHKSDKTLDAFLANEMGAGCQREVYACGCRADHGEVRKPRQGNAEVHSHFLHEGWRVDDRWH